MKCSAADCDQRGTRRGLCNRHYKRWLAHGDPSINLRPRAPNRSRTTCSICGKPEHAKRLCKTHYMDTRRATLATDLCSVPGCIRARARTGGWCAAHYQRWRTHGDPLAGPPMRRIRGRGMPHSYYKEKRRASAPMTREAAHWIPILRGDPCSYCGDRTEHIDHIIPVVAGGTSGIENLTASCARCNRSKKTQSLLGFLLARASSRAPSPA